MNTTPIIESIIKSIQNSEISEENIKEYIDNHNEEFLINVDKINAIFDALIEKKELGIMNVLIKENKKQMEILMKKYDAEVKLKKKEEEEEKDKADEEKEGLIEIPKITKAIYNRVCRLPVSVKHQLFDCDKIPCDNNIIFHFKYLDDNEVHKTREYSRIKCGDVTNNYIQTIYNKKTKNLSIIMPDKKYVDKIMAHRSGANKKYSFIPIKISYVGSRIGHASYLIIENGSGSVYYFDPNSICEPDNDFIDKSFGFIFEKYGLHYINICNWNHHKEALQFPDEYREWYNNGDCVILALLFVKLLEEQENLSPKVLLDKLFAVAIKKRKAMVNQLYLDVYSCIPKSSGKKKKE